MLDCVIQGGDGVADVALALMIESLEHDEVRARRKSPSRAVRGLPAPRDDPRYVGAVAVPVVRLRTGSDEVREVHDTPVVQIVVCGSDARIYDRDADSRAVHPKVLLDPPCTHDRGRRLEGAGDRPVRGDGSDECRALQHRQ